MTGAEQLSAGSTNDWKNRDRVVLDRRFERTHGGVFDSTHGRGGTPHTTHTAHTAHHTRTLHTKMAMRDERELNCLIQVFSAGELICQFGARLDISNNKQINQLIDKSINQLIKLFFFNDVRKL